MKVEGLLGDVRESITVRRVFGEPYSSDGVTVIPAATVSGGGGGGGGEASGEAGGDQSGWGGGFGVHARPAGAYVISGGTVRWRPAVDVNLAVATAGAVAITYLLVRALRRRG